MSNPVFGQEDLRNAIARATYYGADILPLDITEHFPPEGISPDDDPRKMGRVTLTATVSPPSLTLQDKRFTGVLRAIDVMSMTFSLGAEGEVSALRGAWGEVGGERAGRLPEPDVVHDPVDPEMSNAIGWRIMAALDTLR
jgi:hypothetical protein